MPTDERLSNVPLLSKRSRGGACGRGRGRTAVLAVAALLGWGGCGEDRDPPPVDGVGSTTGGASSSGAGLPDLGAADESTGPGWPLPTDDDLLTCVGACEGPWDCCPPGTEGQCPGPSFPFNYMCIDGLCVMPPCEAGDCQAEGEQCLVIRGAPRCATVCDGDAACTALDPASTCAGTDDEGTPYCMAHCTSPGVFCGNASCDEASGECVCTGDGQCQADQRCV